MANWQSGYDMVTTQEETVPDSGFYRIVATTANASVEVKQTADQGYAPLVTVVVGTPQVVRLTGGDLIKATFDNKCTIKRLKNERYF